MRTAAPATLPLFRSELQAELLATLLLDAREGLTIRELGDRTAANRSSVHRELDRLVRAGILERETTGRTGVYRVAESPLKEPLRTLVERTVGVEHELARRLERQAGVEAAAIYGSWASGGISPTSDIDVLVVGSATLDDLLAVLRPLERRVGREINLKLYAPQELRDRLAEGSGFLHTVLSRPLRPLVGDLPAPP